MRPSSAKAVLLSMRHPIVSQQGSPAAAFAVVAVLELAVALLHIGIGARPLGPHTVIMAILAFDPNNFDHQIVVNLRLARLVGGLLAGGALGIAGVLLQAVVRNPLGEPHILGLNAGAALAVVLVNTLGIQILSAGPMRPATAAIGAAILFTGVMVLASAGKGGATPLKVTLCGVALSAFASSLTSAILILDDESLLDLRLWLAGDLAGVSYNMLKHALAPIVLAGLAALLLASRLNVLALGDQAAMGLGVRVLPTRLAGLLASAVLCGTAVSIAGPIGFIGLIVPHLSRRFVGGDIRRLLPMSAMAGAIVVLGADCMARTLLAPRELATGVMTAVIGAPLFIVIVSRYFR